MDIILIINSRAIIIEFLSECRYLNRIIWPSDWTIYTLCIHKSVLDKPGYVHTVGVFVLFSIMLKQLLTSQIKNNNTLFKLQYGSAYSHNQERNQKSKRNKITSKSYRGPIKCFEKLDN